MSFDYKRVLEGLVQIIKLAKDGSYQANIRELFDLLMKWILLRLWGGQPTLISAI